MAPSGLSITKLGVEARAADDRIRGCLCVKAVLTGGVDGNGKVARAELFPAGSPSYLSTARILPLPLLARTGPSSSRHARYAQAAESLLGPLQHVAKTSRHSATLVVEQSNGQTHLVARPSAAGSRVNPERQEWAVLFDYEVVVRRASGQFHASISIPRCLENLVRITLSSSTSSADGDVRFTSQPAIRFLTRLPSYVPATHSNSSSSEQIAREGWEDAEDWSDGETEEGWEMDDNGVETIWWEGRFPSTDILDLQWDAPFSEMPRLAILPALHMESPHSFEIIFEAPIQAQTHSLHMCSILPPQWGWAELSIEAETLVTWHCTDGPWGSDFGAEEMDASMLDLRESDADDSFATVKARRNKNGPADCSMKTGGGIDGRTSSIDLFKQTLPRDVSHDFSFEESAPQTGSSTPGRRASRLNGAVNAPTPMRGNHFELHFQPSSRPQIVTVRGVLMPAHPGIVSTDVRLPIFTLDERPPAELLIECSFATLLQPGEDVNVIARYTQKGYGTFASSGLASSPLTAAIPPTTTDAQLPASPANPEPASELIPPATSSPRRPRFGLFSWSSLLHLFVLYVVLSQAQRFQRLQSELGQVRDEMVNQRELRLLVEHRLEEREELDRRLQRELMEALGTEGMGACVVDDLAVRLDDGADVLGARAVWNKVASHPSIRSMEASISWVWKAFKWLLGPV